MQMIKFIIIALFLTLAKLQELTFTLIHDQFATITQQKHSLQVYDLT